MTEPSNPKCFETEPVGQSAAGPAHSKVLFGDVNPSGRLPVTFERRWEDNPVSDSYYPAARTNKVVYKEGVFVGYRGYEKKKQWRAEPGDFDVLVGPSSAQIELRGKLTVAPTRTAGDAGRK